MMATVYMKQWSMLVWPYQLVVLLTTMLMWLPEHHCMITSDETCAGQQLSLSCTDGWLIHVIYETYSYSMEPCTSDLDPLTVTCTKAEFLAPVSVTHCNGQRSCMFTVPTNTTISSCNKMATALSVHYKCISEASVFTICSDVIFQDTEQLYLATPNFPSNILEEQKNCSCTVTGENINGTVLQQTRTPDSSVIMILSTNRGTQHINGRNILNNLIFSNLTKINLFLENKLDQQVYKLWLGFTGKGMSLKCQYEQPQPVTSPAGVSVNPTSSLVTGTSSWVTDKTEEAILLSTQQSKLNQTVLFPQNISITPTETYSSKSNLINCSETQNGENIKCESTNALFGISSSLSETPESSTWTWEQDSVVSTSGDLISLEIKSTMQDNTRGTKESKTESLSLARTRTETQPVHSSSSTDGLSSMRNTVGASMTDNSWTLSKASSRTTNPDTAKTDSMVAPYRTQHIVGTNSVSSATPSSVIPNTTQSTPGLQPNTSDQDLVLLVIVGCLAFVMLAAMVIFTIIMWRRANTNQHTQEETHIYDAYHHDNGSVGPDHLGDGHSFYTDSANESIMI